ncbi:GNAT family N-acetyltransferase [Lactiplantibacillus mudanjiangensis]|uniref:Acetyltransferase [Lactobacillus paraplantarum] n=1 Tax=Lactiplantibacillus mudanjiangensis TaxID=1296538 RepID=A0A660E3H8_9LACO|nr:GNAT family N-acetyltransferase [Lactiplantibacillus mudanjiangensis]VDG21166.1 acetyltransferase [Lactobacillus paraplantarum] [Lactiplantibacillus mudanjiangensis]VDG22897.1 acetyltransferase [Lactobacillus paraplantarum] [Lactiplantibacillus mudanjiangensis]VDG29243.1 acetyltransferase [Lactobacillus paraplantarum] [Lactiplantibacillus mudanjiangensis]VDG31769.1 acetyltransferase [Lactobacillus paraplantarum] [Lactiplantibacillus mudanjiangensis]
MAINLLTAPTESQLDRLMAIWLQGNLDAHPFVRPDYWRKQAPAVREALPQAKLLVATDRDQIQGFLGLQDYYIAGIFIAAGARQQGLGSALLTTAKQQQSKLELSVYVANRVAVAFYHHSDFHVHAQAIDKDTNQPEYTMRWHR